MFVIQNRSTGGCLCDDHLHTLTFPDVWSALEFLSKKGYIADYLDRFRSSYPDRTIVGIYQIVWDDSHAW